MADDDIRRSRGPNVRCMSRITVPGPLEGVAWPVASAQQFGLSYGWTRNPRFARPFHGIRQASEPIGWIERARAYWSKPRPGQVLVGVHAFAHWGIPVPRRLRRALDEDLVVAVAHDRPRPRSAGVLARRIRRDLLQSAAIEDFVVATPELALLSMAPQLTLRERVVCVDAAVTTSTNYPDLRARVPFPQLAAFAAAAGSATGGRALREAVELSRVGVESPQESLVRFALVEAGLPEPEVQVEVCTESGSLVAVLDLAYRTARIDIEYEGDHHRVDQEQWHRDIQRERWLTGHGWHVIRLTKDDLHHRMPEVIALIRRLLRERTPDCPELDA